MSKNHLNILAEELKTILSDLEQNIHDAPDELTKSDFEGRVTALQFIQSRLTSFLNGEKQTTIPSLNDFIGQNVTVTVFTSGAEGEEYFEGTLLGFDGVFIVLSQPGARNPIFVPFPKVESVTFKESGEQA